jgi:hypothetical protein
VRKTQVKISRSTLGLAAEYAVASELCRRNIYAQLTLGHQKRTDLLIFGEGNRLLRIEVKGKQSRDWPNCKGIYGENVFLVFVDFAGKDESERPDFYVLTVQDWIDFVRGEIARITAKRPEKRIELDKHNVPIFTTEVNASGKPYRGMGVRPDQIQQHKEQWSKIVQAIGHTE